MTKQEIKEMIQKTMIDTDNLSEEDVLNLINKIKPEEVSYG